MDLRAPARPGTTIPCPSLMPCGQQSRRTYYIIHGAWCTYAPSSSSATAAPGDTALWVAVWRVQCHHTHGWTNKLHCGGNMFRPAQPTEMAPAFDLLSPGSPLV
ncbi:unnamed protein product [Triticum turgidum subsp. durum]|uniref:Uncharacterized protein n=1 Tax=Triticum turgidum subsp. durum TaxID=4567 RepID=A0A9R0ZN18_TRITD|nr:unnamed protein product [Triticum turgidum subsp. durum]